MTWGLAKIKGTLFAALLLGIIVSWIPEFGEILVWWLRVQ